jgi:putative toxin-antitoxin system antitoxin component (TIGR02293 family)
MKPTDIGTRTKKAALRGATKKPLVARPVGRRIASVYSKGGHGVVLFHVDTAMGRRPAHDVPVALQVKAMEAGLRESELTDLQTSLDLSSERLFSLVGLSKATFHRRKTTGTNLNPLVSDRVVRFAMLLSKAISVLGSKDEANKWLNSPQFGLGGAVPLDYAKSEIGAREVEKLLGRIEYGVYT